MRDPWTVAQTWTLLTMLATAIAVPTGIVVYFQRKNQTPTEQKWVDDWWWEYGHHFDELDSDNEGEALPPGAA